MKSLSFFCDTFIIQYIQYFYDTVYPSFGWLIQHMVTCDLKCKQTSNTTFNIIYQKFAKSCSGFYKVWIVFLGSGKSVYQGSFTYMGCKCF